jgi:hypothetical protein
MQRPGLDGYRGIGNVVLGRSLPATRGPVFISHSRRDSDLVNALETLLDAGSPRSREQQFFCSSLALQGPRPSRPLRREIWRALRAARYAIFVVTPAFLDSRECTYELGAADALGIPPICLLAPSLEFRDDLIPLSHKLGGYLNNRRDLAAVHGEIATAFDYTPVEHERFGELVEQVIQRAEQIPASIPGRQAPDLMKTVSKKGKARRRPAAPARRS